MTDMWQKLRAPFPADKISWRVGATNADKSKGMALAYIDARDVMERLDEVVGPAGWQCRYPHANGKTVCEIGLRCQDPAEWLWKSDGAGDTDHEAEKGALSDAFKRAAVRWGIGRYLYDLGSPWVRIEQRGRSYVIAESEYANLRKLLEKDAKEHAPQPEPIDPDESRQVCDHIVRLLDECDTEGDSQTWRETSRPKLARMLKKHRSEAIKEWLVHALRFCETREDYDIFESDNAKTIEALEPNDRTLFNNALSAQKHARLKGKAA